MNTQIIDLGLLFLNANLNYTQCCRFPLMTCLLSKRLKLLLMYCVSQFFWSYSGNSINILVGY